MFATSNLSGSPFVGNNVRGDEGRRDSNRERERDTEAQREREREREISSKVCISRDFIVGYLCVNNLLFLCLSYIMQTVVNNS